MFVAFVGNYEVVCVRILLAAYILPGTIYYIYIYVCVIII